MEIRLSVNLLPSNFILKETTSINLYFELNILFNVIKADDVNPRTLFGINLFLIKNNSRLMSEYRISISNFLLISLIFALDSFRLGI